MNGPGGQKMANEQRLIDANEALKKMQNWNTKERLINCVEDAPTVDAVEVVRCKECVSSMYFPHTEKCWCKAPFGMVGNTPVDPNGFCSYGERRNDGKSTSA